MEKGLVLEPNERKKKSLPSQFALKGDILELYDNKRINFLLLYFAHFLRQYTNWFCVFQHDDFRMGVYDICWVQCSDKVYVYNSIFNLFTQKVDVITFYTHSSINHTER